MTATIALVIAQPTSGGFLFSFTDPSGLEAEAEFTLLNPTTLVIRLQNLSTGAPQDFTSADQLLTGISWDFGAVGAVLGDNTITGGGAIIGPFSSTVDFDAGSFGAGTNVGGEWGFGNNDGSGGLTNVVSGNAAGVTAFGGPNLDGPGGLNGPQGGLISAAFALPLGGLGAIEDEIIITLSLSAAINDAQLLADLQANGVQVEFGSDAAFIPGELVPAPGALALLAVGALARRRRRSA